MTELSRMFDGAMQRLQSEGRAIDLFFRDDDADVDEETLWRLLDLFLAHRRPLNLEVIPGRLERGAAEKLRRRAKEAPALLELNQHGWRHLNHETTGRKCEFGPSRDFETQRADIAAGKTRMEEAFADLWHPVFTPPWNRCTADTHRALDQLGFRVFSKDRGRDLVDGYGFREISTTLDLYRWKDGAQMRPAEEILRDMLIQFEQPGPVGLLLHHKVMNAAAFAFLDWLLGELASSPGVRIHTFRSLLESEEIISERN